MIFYILLHIYAVIFYILLHIFIFILLIYIIYLLFIINLLKIKKNLLNSNLELYSFFIKCLKILILAYFMTRKDLFCILMKRASIRCKVCQNQSIDSKVINRKVLFCNLTIIKKKD